MKCTSPVLQGVAWCIMQPNEYRRLRALAVAVCRRVLLCSAMQSGDRLGEQILSATEQLCDDCGLPVSICNAKAMVQMAIDKHGAEAVARVMPADLTSATLDRPEAGSVWEPMVTAPKDGRLILLARVPVSSFHNMFVAYWSDDIDEWKYYVSGTIRQPTHWMPLPPPPTP